MEVMSNSYEKQDVVQKINGMCQCCESEQHVFIVGSKGIPAAYGGFETFVEKLTEHRVSNQIRYHIAGMSRDTLQYEYNGAACFHIKVPNIGPARAVYYDISALQHCINYCKLRPEIQNPIFYILACRIGPFIGYFKNEIQKLGGVLYLNPDGHEWKRAKWNALIRKYWKLSECLMIKHADMAICDSKSIEKYIQDTYEKYRVKTTFIAYGAEMSASPLLDDDDEYQNWMKVHKLAPKDYYLVVGRFVPENNYELMIREFMKSTSRHDFVLITNVSERFLKELKMKTGFEQDPRIKFVGTVYKQKLLKKIRENAYGYFHGHEVGGTNPSLLEALASTSLNLLLNVGFNREVAEDAALYWEKCEGSLASLIEQADEMSMEERTALGIRAKRRIRDFYSWEHIVSEYENVFLEVKNLNTEGIVI